MRKISAYARKVRRTGMLANGAGWMNAIERSRPYNDEPVFPGGKVLNTLSAAVKSAIVVRESFEAIRTGDCKDGLEWDVLAEVVDVAVVRAIQIAGNDKATNPMLPILLDGNDALKRMRERHDKHGSWAFDGPAVAQILSCIDIYEEILLKSSPAQMTKAREIRIDVLRGKQNRELAPPEKAAA